jgi:hypothetical protein
MAARLQRTRDDTWDGRQNLLNGDWPFYAGRAQR